jgi:hypothetical protein
MSRRHRRLRVDVGYACAAQRRFLGDAHVHQRELPVALVGDGATDSAGAVGRKFRRHRPRKVAIAGLLFSAVR